MGEDEYGAEYLIGSSTGRDVSDIVFSYDADAQKLTLVTLAVESGAKDQLAAYGYYADLAIYAGAPVEPELVELPEDAEVKTYYINAYDTYFEEGIEEREVAVAVVGQDVYFQGLSEYAPATSWVKGTVGADSIVVEANQYMGIFTYVDQEENATDFAMYFYGAKFAYDAETDTYTSLGGYQTVGGGYLWDEVTNVIITPQPVGVQSVEAAANGTATYFDLTGRRTADNAKGLLIRQQRLSDGTLKTTKVIRK